MIKRTVAILSMAVLLVALFAVPAFAEGYNNGQYNYTTGNNESDYAANAGIYVRDAVGASQEATSSGPHGGYATTTNKCQDCHSTHYATGSYMLLRADDRANACSFCHAGGGGSETNIQMDNDYDTTSVESTDTMGYGTGHTLGYAGNAPDGINPAFSDASGLACFDCHTPHGNSARVLEVFGAPGDLAGKGDLVPGSLYKANLAMPEASKTKVDETGITSIDDVHLGAGDSPTQAQFQAFGAWIMNGADPADMQAEAGPAMMNWWVYWGIDADKGNIVTTFFNLDGEQETWKKPLFPKGKFLLLKNPNDNGTDDMDVAATGETADGKKKMATDWDNPDGPAATWGGSMMKFSMAGQDWEFPLKFPWASKGIAMENEFCADCHDGAAGMSTQKAVVWRPNPSDTTTGTYVTASSHDSNPKGCARQQILNPEDGYNMGPHCRNCHTGAASCEQCHGSDTYDYNGMYRENWYSDGSYTAYGTGINEEGKTSYEPVADVKTSAVADINGQCIDGGFSYPHRTLGANMLKDSLYGVDFDGTPVAFGDTRDAVGSTASDVAAYFNKTEAEYFDNAANDDYQNSWRVDEIVGASVDNLDSVCIDCHGDATYYSTEATAGGMYLDENFQFFQLQGWELLLHGLP